MQDDGFCVWVVGSDGNFRGHCRLDTQHATEGMVDVTSLATLVQIARGDTDVVVPGLGCGQEMSEGVEFKSDGNARGPLRQRVRGADEQLVRCYDVFFKPIANWLQPESYFRSIKILLLQDQRRPKARSSAENFWSAICSRSR